MVFPRNQYKTGYYGEFNPGHVLFKNNKVFCVIDWMIKYEEALYDIGSSMVVAIEQNKGINVKKLKAFIQGYQSERKITKLEKKHLFDAFKYGIIKYGVWGLFDLENDNFYKNKKDMDSQDLYFLEYLQNIKREEFGNLLELK